MQYALGNWCEAWTDDSECTMVSSPGAFGTYPWVDYKSGLYGIFFMNGRLPHVVKYLTRARQEVLSKWGQAVTTY